MEINYDEMSIYQELKFLNELVNIDESINYNEIKQFNDAVEKVEKYIKNIYNKISFTKVNIAELFNFIKY